MTWLQLHQTINKKHYFHFLEGIFQYVVQKNVFLIDNFYFDRIYETKWSMRVCDFTTITSRKIQQSGYSGF